MAWCARLETAASGAVQGRLVGRIGACLDLRARAGDYAQVANAAHVVPGAAAPRGCVGVAYAGAAGGCRVGELGGAVRRAVQGRLVGIYFFSPLYELGHTAFLSLAGAPLGDRSVRW